MTVVPFLSYEACISFLVINLTKPLLSRMAPETRGQDGGNLPPPPEPSMEQVLRLMLEEREAARAERQANLATLQHLAQIATNHNNRGGNDDEEPATSLGISKTPTLQPSPSPPSPWTPMIGSAL
jgi:hypothetical protein